MKFKKDDRVKRVLDCNTNHIPVDSVGTVTGYNEDFNLVLVHWDHLKSKKHVGHKYGNCEDRLQLLLPSATPIAAELTEWHRRLHSDMYETGSAISITDEFLKPTNPKDRAATHRLDLTLFPETARIFGALAMTEGDSKYGGYNYRESGVNTSTYVAALYRHIGKYYDRGEWADEKTGVPHLANALACVAVLIDGHVKNNLKDDRPPKIEANLYTWAEELSRKLHEMFPNGPTRYTQLVNGGTNDSVPDWLIEKP